MADAHTETTPTAESKSPSTGRDNVFLVENADMDLATLFARVDKKPVAQEEPAPEVSPAKPAVQAPEANAVSMPLQKGVAPKKALWKRATVIGTLASLVVAAAGGMLVDKMLKPPTAQRLLKNAAVVRQPIAVPSAVERIEVFLSAQAKEKEELLCMNLAVHASRPDAEAVLSELRVALRDAVYAFLSQQHPEKNVRRSWSPIVEKELLAELQRRFPQAGLVAVELEDLQRI
ncbi:hypothetical protein [Desulfosoma sp.]|uniref:hypothetical protein n=1 Tax=Desulfosoma sp. TaxID=2603217 RepID=UPI00404B9F0C